MRKGRWSRLALCAVLLAGLLCPMAGAAVVSTPEPAGGAGTVYVAGNPDWYPIEYYDAGTGTYEGVLPRLLARISEKTGLSFTYLRAGEEDQRLRMAENKQVELLSGCALDGPETKLPGVRATGTILSFPLDGEQTQVCLAFTAIAGESLTTAVEGALQSISQQELAEIALQWTLDRPARTAPRWLAAVLAAAVALLLTGIVVLLVRLRRYRRAAMHDDAYDQTTGIGNKVYFTQRFDREIPDQYRGLYCVAFVGFDIERVNQYYGEAAAEEQLRFAANELMLSTADNEITARVSGGGFALARPCGGKEEAAAWAQALLDRLNRYGEKYGKDYHPDFHMGIYLLQPSDRDCEMVLYNARQGYQKALSSGLACVFASAEGLKRKNQELQLKKQTLDAIQNREFRMFLQPIIRKDGRISSAEALSRWDHPQRGLLYPGSYIGLMEQEKTVPALDFYIFEEACRRLELWQRQGWTYSISCNFTRISIGHPDFLSRLEQIAARYFFSHDRLVIEITEDTMEGSKEIAFANLSRCKELGFRIALDDAGSGYTSFSDLRDYPLDFVKIDRSILNAAVNQRGVALLRGMIALAHSLQMEVLCEGVETENQAELLRRLDCDYLQGYYFYRGLPLEEAERLFREDAAAGRQNDPRLWEK